MTAAKKETHSYKGWLNSDSFIKRAFAITGYNLVSGLIIYGVLLAVIAVIAGIMGLFSLFAA